MSDGCISLLLTIEQYLMAVFPYYKLLNNIWWLYFLIINYWTISDGCISLLLTIEQYLMAVFPYY